MKKEQLKIDSEPKKILIISEAYVIYTVHGYQVVVDVIERKSKREYYIFITSKSIATPLEQLKIENKGKMAGLEFWLYKMTSEKFSPYVLEE